MSGILPLKACHRLLEHLVDSDGVLQCQLFGERDEKGQAFLILQVEGQVRVLCQRCLLPVDWPLAIGSRLLLVPPGEEWPADDELGGLGDESVDAIEAVRELAVADLVEDEVLLALPIVPRHEVCLSLAGEGAGGSDGAASSGKEPSGPFAVLARLKKY